jgi:hypothetical protein
MERFPHKLRAMRRGLITTLALVCAMFAAATSVAAAASGGTAAEAISDCNNNGHLTAQYSASTLRTALATMPADVREYTDCYDVIQKQLFAELGASGTASGTTTSSSSGSVLPTPVLVIIVLLVLAALTFGAIAIRRNRSGGPSDPDSGASNSEGQDGPGDPGGSGGAAPQ